MFELARVGAHLSQYGVEDIKMRVEIDAIGRLQALGLVAFLLLHEYVQLYDDIADTLYDFSAMFNNGLIYGHYANCNCNRKLHC